MTEDSKGRHCPQNREIIRLLNVFNVVDSNDLTVFISTTRQEKNPEKEWNTKYHILGGQGFDRRTLK